MSLIFTLKIKNYKNEIYELTHDYEHYYVMSVSGLTPPVTTINTTVSGIHDGSYYNSSRVQQRNIVITVGLRGNKQFPVNLESSDTVTALTEMLPLTLDMSELNGNEKYYYLDTSLPSSPEKVGHISEGDIMLYGDSCLVVFYESFDTSYSYTKIGNISDTSGLADTQDLFGNETITDIAKAHGRTSAQVILRWHLQAGYITIPGSQNPDHILENISIFDFELSDEEMQRMAELHTGQRYENW